MYFTGKRKYAFITTAMGAIEIRKTDGVTQNRLKSVFYFLKGLEIFLLRHKKRPGKLAEISGSYSYFTSNITFLCALKILPPEAPNVRAIGC